jgi:nucleotide-binding universal stress UspA family protein
MKILLAVDGSAYTKRMLAYLGAHDELFGETPEYHAITVVAPVTAHVTRFLDKAIIDRFYADEAKRVLEPVQAFAEMNHWNLVATHRVGRAADVIAETAISGGFDLLVIGSHGHSSLANLLLGSVTSRVMALSTTPLLVIR